LTLPVTPGRAVDTVWPVNVFPEIVPLSVPKSPAVFEYEPEKEDPFVTTVTRKVAVPLSPDVNVSVPE
jgi:hypothetical protein